MVKSLLEDKDILCIRCWRGFADMVGEAFPDSFAMVVFGEEGESEQDECEVQTLVLPDGT